MKKIIAADLFCGAGGASTGLLRAVRHFGLDVDLLAVNHWPTAIDTHSLNHPGVRHLCATLEHVRPAEAVPGGRLNLLLAGPECTHHSTARGGKPINDQSRATAWCVVKWAQELYIDTILIENVPEFRTWGPLGANGKPLKSKKGQTYRAFLDALRSLDYTIEERVVCAADYGDPTTRQRLFIICRRGKNAKLVAFPEPTHAKRTFPTIGGKRKQPWRAAREVIDWTLEGRSIFDPERRPLKPNTMRRILAGLERFGGPELHPFLVILRQHMDGKSIDEPMPTIAAGGQHIGLAQPMLMHTTHGGRARAIDDPLPTVTGANRGELAVVESFVLSQQSGGAPRSTEQPLPTIATDGAISLVEPFIVPQFSEGQPKSVDDPLGTLTTTSRGVGIAQPFVLPLDGIEPFVITPGGANLRQPSSVDDPLPTVTCTERFGVAQAFILDAAHGSVTANDDNRRAKSLDDPIGTVTGSNRFGVVEPFVLQQQSNGAPRTTDEPLPTVTCGGKQALVQPFLQSYYGTLNISSCDDPVPTVTTKQRFGLVMPVIERDGVRYALDIRFRMLQPHELAGAMSFPKSYVFTGNKEDQVKQIGNSWPGETAFALCRHLLAPYAGKVKTPARRIA